MSMRHKPNVPFVPMTRLKTPERTPIDIDYSVAELTGAAVEPEVAELEASGFAIAHVMRANPLVADKGYLDGIHAHLQAQYGQDNVRYLVPPEIWSMKLDSHTGQMPSCLWCAS